MQIENHKEQVPFAHYCALWKSVDPAEAVGRSRAAFDESAGEFRLCLLGVTYFLHWPDFAVRADQNDAFALRNIPAQILMIRYLMDAYPDAFHGKFLTFRETPWGEVYLKPFTGRCLNRAAFTFGPHIAAFRGAMEKMGARRLSHGDSSYEVEFLPGLLMQIIVWEGDDEFPPNSQILFSDNFPAAFAAEDLVVCADLLISDAKSHM